jgi:tRNA threonylcarbamoyladenosine biosynthesis protein TsaE
MTRYCDVLDRCREGGLGLYDLYAWKTASNTEKWYNRQMRMKMNSVEETQTVAAALASIIQPGDTLLLNGDLGAGKTIFTQGFARALGMKRPLKSPTFTLVREYQTPHFQLNHLDVYRLGEEGGADELGLNEYFNPTSVTIVEWSEFITNDLPQDYLQIDLTRLEHDIADTQRAIEITAQGVVSQQRLQELEEALDGTIH